MKISFNFLGITVLLFIVEIFIGVFVKDKLIRPFVGDVLVVCLVYSFIRIFYTGRIFFLAIGVLVFAYLVEFLQYVNFVERIGIPQGSLGYIIFGATFDVFDLLAYTLGVVICCCLDSLRKDHYE